MRLRSIDPQLEKLLSDAQKAEQNFFCIFWHCFKKLPDESLSVIGKFKELAPLLERQMPNLQGNENIVEKIDNDYFQAEEMGKTENAEILFRAARIAASVVAQADAHGPADFIEAAYEAIISTNHPELTAREILEMLA